jgi:type II secretory pathway pseudopilin PulG
MAAELLVLFALLAVVAPLVLYALVRAEHDDRQTMDREDAERAARRDTDDRRYDDRP